MPLFLQGNFGAQLVKEIENERDLAWRALAGRRSLQHCEALTIGVQVKVGSTAQVPNLSGTNEVFGPLPGNIGKDKSPTTIRQSNKVMEVTCSLTC